MPLELRTPEYTVLEYCEMNDRKEVKVNRNYQRSDEVWPRTAQSFLIETILLNYPIPKLFLHQKTDLRTNRTLREIVDGQQRTKAILGFFHDEFALTNNVTLGEATGRKLSQLPDELRQQFLEYGLKFDVFVGATDEQVREVFRRMNSFTVPLNAEEQRHAVFQGEFKWFMLRLSTDYAEAFREARVFNQKALVRMQDQKLLTEIVAAFFLGIATTNKRTLDRVYREHDRPQDFPLERRRELDRRARAALDVVFRWRDLFDTPLMRPHQVYSLLLAVMHVMEPVETLNECFAVDTALAAEETIIVNLSRLAEAIGREEEAAGIFQPFVKASAEGTNIGSQRKARFDWFCRALTDRLPA